MRDSKFLGIQPRYTASGVIEEFDLCRYEQFLGIRSVDGRVNRCFKTEFFEHPYVEMKLPQFGVPKMRKKTFPQVGHYYIKYNHSKKDDFSSSYLGMEMPKILLLTG